MKNKQISRSFSTFTIVFILTIALSNTHLIDAQIINNNDYIENYSFEQTILYWTVTEVISIDKTDLAYVPSLVVDSENNVHVVWESVILGGTLNEHQISYKYWDALSNSWSSIEIISTESTNGAFTPDIAVDDNNNLHVVWADETNYDSSGDDRDIFYKKWNASTSTWTTTDVVSTGSSDYSLNPDLSIDSSGNPHVVWVDDYEIFYSYWNDISSSWTSAEQISTAGIWSANTPDIDIDISDNIHVAFEQAGSEDMNLHYTMWNASISSWTTSVDISIGIYFDAFNPSIDSDSKGNVHVTWNGNANGAEHNIYYRKWDVVLGDWLAFESISTETSDYLQYPSMFVDSFDNVHVSWEDSSNYDLCGTDWDIFYKYWDSSNSSWTITEVISTESTGDSIYSSIGVSKNGVVHISWQDVTDYLGAAADEDIFYKTQTGSPTTPELAFIVPNPSETNSIYLDWNDVEIASIYYIYRSTSYIWTIDELIPIASATFSEYLDIVPSAGYYYYVVAAGNEVSNSTHSNCQFVEVKTPELDIPELSFILPNPTESDIISLIWDSIDGATEYYIYRSDSYIWSVEGLTPIATENSETYIDALPEEGFYFYVVVATDGIRNSTHSNCEYILYKLPSLSEFTIVSSLILGSFVILFVIMRTRKKK